MIISFNSKLEHNRLLNIFKRCAKEVLSRKNLHKRNHFEMKTQIKPHSNVNLKRLTNLVPAIPCLPNKDSSNVDTYSTS